MPKTARALQRLEAGDPSVGIGIVATALWLIQRDGELRNLASPEHDRGAIEMDVREAVELSRALGPLQRPVMPQPYTVQSLFEHSCTLSCDLFGVKSHLRI